MFSSSSLESSSSSEAATRYPYSSPNQRPRSISRQRGPQKGLSGHCSGPPSINRWHIGQRTFIIGNSRRGLGAFPRRAGISLPFGGRPCGAFAGFGGRAVRAGTLRRFRGCFLRLGGTLVRLAAVVGLVKSRTLEQDGRSPAEEASQFALTALGALLQRLIAHRLKLVEVVIARVTLIFVRRHLCLLLPSPRVATRGLYPFETMTLAGRSTRS